MIRLVSIGVSCVGSGTAKLLNGVGQFDGPAVQRLSDDGCLSPSPDEGFKVGQGADSTGRQNGKAWNTGEAVDVLEVWAAQGTIPLDVGVDYPLEAFVPQTPREIENVPLSRVLPGVNRQLAVSGIEPDHDPAVVPRQASAPECAGWLSIPPADRGGAKHDPVDPNVQSGIHLLKVSEAAAELDRDLGGADYFLDQGKLDRRTCQGAVEVHDVQPWRTKLLPTVRHRDGVIAVNSFSREVALQ
jgi:hypothetical protein